MQSNLLLLGSGKWPGKIKSVVGRQNSEILINQISAREFLKLNLEQMKPILKDNVVWIASNPKNQILILNKIKSFSNKVILEKPYAVNLNELTQMREMSLISNNKFYVSEPWRHSLLWQDAQTRLMQVAGLKRLTIYRGGPAEREYIDPPWDWMQHDLGLLSDLLFSQKDHLNIDFEFFNNNKNLKVYIDDSKEFLIELNLGLFPQRNESWNLNGKMFVDFSDKELFDDDPINNMFEYVSDENFQNIFENQVWLTNLVITRLDYSKQL